MRVIDARRARSTARGWTPLRCSLGAGRSVGKGLDLRRLQPARLRGESQADHAERGGGPGTVLEDLDAQHPVVGLPDPERFSLSRTVEVHPYRIPVRSV